jgi:hypothetical protein
MTPDQFFALDIIARLQLAKDALVDDPILAQDAGVAIHVSDVISDATSPSSIGWPNQPIR